MKIVQLITDEREAHRVYDKDAPWFGPAPAALVQGLMTIPELEVHIVSCAKRRMPSPEKLADNIYFHSLVVPSLGWLKTGYQGCVRATLRKVREIQPDLVHGQGTERDCSLSAVLTGRPNVITLHGNMAPLSRHLRAKPGSYLWLTGLLENFTVPRAGGVFCNSAYTEELVRPRNPRLWRVSNAINTDFFAPLPPPGEREQPTLINAGVISPRKRQVELLAMFRQLHEQGHNCRIVFAGRLPPEPYARTFQQEMARPGAEAYATYAGNKAGAELVRTFDEADGSVHFPTEEAFGLVVAEALSRNLKFFGARVGGIVDIASGIEQAELIEADDWTELKEAIIRWLEAGHPRPRESAAVMAERYHPRVIAQQHVEIYREVLTS